MSLPIIYANSNITVDVNKEVHTDSSGGSFDITINSGSVDDKIKFIDIGRNWRLNPVTILASNFDLFDNGLNYYELTYPGYLEIINVGSMWLTFFAPLNDPNIVNNVVTTNLSSNIYNNTLTLSLNESDANKVLAGPLTGTSEPSYRSLVSADLKSSPINNGLFYNSSGNIEQSNDLIYEDDTLNTPNLKISESMGKVNLVGGFATVTTSRVTSTSTIFLTNQSVSGVMGNLRVGTKTNGVSFTIISSSLLDTSSIGWLIIN